jgi:hypothetical protein
MGAFNTGCDAVNLQNHTSTAASGSRTRSIPFFFCAAIAELYGHKLKLKAKHEIIYDNLGQADVRKC